MSRVQGTLARLRLLFASRTAEARMDDEFRFHIEMETEKNIRAGMSPSEARRHAAVADLQEPLQRELSDSGNSCCYSCNSAVLP